MPFFNPRERAFIETVSALAYCNPFIPRRIELERAALGEDYDDSEPAWNLDPRIGAAKANVMRMADKAAALCEAASQRVAQGDCPSDGERESWYDLALVAIYYKHWEAIDRLAQPASSLATDSEPDAADAFRAFRKDAERWFKPCAPGLRLGDIAHQFACLFQLRRAFANVYHYIVGASKPAIALRAAIYESIFTHDVKRYRLMLYKRMGEFTTLITGPTGTGKELVARAIGHSRYVPFDTRQMRFTEPYAGSFHALNLSAMSPTLIESELFGHKRGAFTGATSDRRGWMEVCTQLGTVFLDEIGELDPIIQVKLLRVLQSRQFSRIGESKLRQFEGKVIAATNQDLSACIAKGQFRSDLYYRLCSDVVPVPRLSDRFIDEPGERRMLVGHLVERLLGIDRDTRSVQLKQGSPDESASLEAEDARLIAWRDQLTDEVEGWIAMNLGDGYAWPGNVRELEQCVRNVVIHGAYEPLASAATQGGVRQRLSHDMLDGTLTADAMLSRYCTLVYARVGSYEGAARELELDRRTVKAKVDAKLLAELRGES